MRPGIKMGDATMEDTMLKDALVCPFNNYHMGITGRGNEVLYMVYEKTAVN